MMDVDENVLSSELVTNLLSDIVLKEGVIDPVYNTSSGSMKGDGFTSSMTKVIVRGKNKILPLIIKKAPNKMKIRDTLPIRISYLQEIKYYKEILPALNKFQIERGVKVPFNSIPICYKTLDSEYSELLVLENIKENGFIVFDKSKQMDQAHVEMVLKAYGQLHAVSFAMKDHDMNRFEELTKNMDNSFLHLNQEFYDMLAEGTDKMKALFNEKNEPDLYRSISSLKEKVITFFKNMLKYNGQYGVLVHGDCWCNNMMFKYEDGHSTPPTDLRLFDFQGGTLSTPVFDLSYFFYVSASQDMLDNLDYYLMVYHDSLRKHMLEMGSDVDKYYSFSVMKEEWNKYAKFGLFLSLLVFRVMIRDDDEILDFGDKEIKSMRDVVMNSSKNEDLINERYKRIGLHFYRNNFI